MNCYYYITVLLFISSWWPFALAVLDQQQYPLVEKLRQTAKPQCCCHRAATICNLHLTKDIVVTDVCSSTSSNTLILNHPAMGTLAKMDTNFAKSVRHLVIHAGYIQLSELTIFQQNSSLTTLTINQTQIYQQEYPLPIVHNIQIERTNLERLPFFNLSYSQSSSIYTIKYVHKLLLDNNLIRNLDVDRTSVGIYSKLQHLSLRGNRISNLDHPILHFTQQLRYLDVSNNTINKIDKTALAHLSQLRSISLKDQRISGPFQFQSDLLHPLLSQIQGRWQLHIELSQRIDCSCSTAWMQSWITKPNDRYFVVNYRHIMCSNKVLPNDSNKAIDRVDYSGCLCQQQDCHDPMTYCHYDNVNGGFASHRSCKNGYATSFESIGLRRRCYRCK